MNKPAALKAVVRYSCPQTGEFAKRSDGVWFSRWWDSRGCYGYGWTKWRRANVDELSAVAGDPEFFRYGFHGVWTRYETDCSRMRLPQD